MPNRHFEGSKSDNPLTRLRVPAKRTCGTAAKISNLGKYAYYYYNYYYYYYYYSITPLFYRALPSSIIRLQTSPASSLRTLTFSSNKKYSVDKKNQLDVTFCILYFSSNSCSTCFGQPCAHHQELTTA